jgi:acetyl esterase
MPLDPQAKILLDQLAAAESPNINDQSPEQARAMYAALAHLGGGGQEVAGVEDRTIPGPAQGIPIRIYTPEKGAAPRPGVVFFHGGGFVIGDLDTHDPDCRAIANGTGAVVVAVDYRLAPEHPYPAAQEDCIAAVGWVHDHASDLGIDPDRLAVAGDSAGGNLAAVVAQQLHANGGPALRAQILIYPATELGMTFPSIKENGEGYLLTEESMRWFMAHYQPVIDEPLASPLLAEDLAGLPPALVITAEFDPLRDEGEAYADKLRAAGVSVIQSRYDGMIHGFFGLRAFFDAATKATDEVCRVLNDLLAEG